MKKTNNNTAYYLKKLIRMIFTRQVIIIFWHKFNKVPVHPAIIRTVDNANVADVLDFQSQDYLKIFEQFLKNGDKGYYAYLDGKCVHRSWVQYNEQIVYPHWSYTMKLMRNQSFIHYCETAPCARGLGIYPAVLHRIVGDFSDKYQVLMSINENNHSSIKGAKKAGFTERESRNHNFTGNKVSQEEELRIVIITQGLSRIVYPLLACSHKVVGIIESAPRHYEQHRVLYDYFSLIREFKYTLSKNPKSLKELCLSLDIPYKFMISNDDKHLEEWVKTINPDVIVVFSMSRLLKENIFSIPKFGTVNLHPSYLPEYRGPNPDFWQYHDMVMNPGVTVHYIDSGEDTGDIIYQERVRVDIGTKSPERSDKLITETGITLILRALDSIKLGNAPRIKQPKHSPTLRARNLSAEDHKAIIDWQAWPIDRIWHILRGTESWLNAIEQPQGIYRGHRWSIMEYEEEIYEHRPYKLGSIQKDSRGFFIQCREGKIRVSVRFSLIKLVKNFVLRIIFRTV